MSRSSPQAARRGGDLRVLLVSAVGGVDPHSGDVTYTEQLLTTPPPGVEFTTYDRAIAEGTLRELGTSKDVRAWGSKWQSRQAWLSRGLAGERKLERVVRQSGLAFREPIRTFIADPEAFDLVHVHVFQTRFVSPSPPVVMSAAGPLDWVYRDAWGWSPRRLRGAAAFDAAAGWALDATLCATRLGRARRFIAFSDHLRDIVVAGGVVPNTVDVVPNYLAVSRSERRPSRTPRRLAFVAKDFEAKGGDLVLGAYRELRRTRDDLELVIVGSEPRLGPAAATADGITWRRFIDRTELLDQVLPGVDVLLHPSRFDGLPYAAMEALSRGVPLVVSDYRALPELVRDGAGRTARSESVDDIVRATKELLEPTAWAAASAAAVRRFESAYSADTQRHRLGASYDRALNPRGQRGSNS